ncbi:hypothetical protein [Salipiger bermudensis]|nr:hypothetical protein [Salipiger bermudensis]
MHTIQTGYRGLGLLVMINLDRLLSIFAIAVALYLGAFLGSL